MLKYAKVCILHIFLSYLPSHWLDTQVVEDGYITVAAK